MLLLLLLLLLLLQYSSLLDLGRCFSFLILYTIGRIPLTRDQPVERSLTTHRITQTQNTSTQTSMSRMRFQPNTPVFERTDAVHALDRADTVLSLLIFLVTSLFARWSRGYVLQLLKHEVCCWSQIHRIVLTCA
jgi:hypothetical protein